jgi:hypothetical protein
MTPEAKVKKKVRQVLAELGAYYAMPVTGGFGNSGVPDFLICFKSKFFGIECKANGNKTTALQDQHLESIRKAGGVALVVDDLNVNNLKEEMNRHVEG